MADDVAEPLAPPEHVGVEPADGGDEGAPVLVAGELGAVAGHGDAHVLQPVRVHARADGQRAAVVGALAVRKHRLHRLLQAVLAGQHREVVLADVAQRVVGVMAGEYAAEGPDQAVALVKAVLPVELLHADEVEVQNRRRLARLREALPLPVGQLEEVAHVGQARELVGVDLVVELVEVRLLLVAHAHEGVGQRAHLVPAAVVQGHVEVPGGQPAGRGGQALEGPGDEAHGEQQKHREQRDDAQGHGQYDPHQARPGGVDLRHRGGDDQFHAVGQRGEGELALLALEGVADELVAVVRPAQPLREAGDGGHVRGVVHIGVRVVEHVAVGVVQAGEAGLVDPYGANLLREGLKGDVHAQHADERPGLVDGDDVGVGLQLVQEVCGIGAHPGGAAALYGGVVPGGVGDIRRVELPGVQRRLGVEARLAHAGVEEAVLGQGDVGAYAVVVGHHAVGVARHAGEGLLDLGAVIGQVGVQPGDLLRRAGVFAGVGPRHAALHQHRAVQGVVGHVAGHLHGLLDALDVLLQRLARVLTDQVHGLHGPAVVGLLQRRIACRERAEYACEYGDDGDRRDLDADRMHHLSSRMINACHVW